MIEIISVACLVAGTVGMFLEPNIGSFAFFIVGGAGWFYAR